MRLHNSALPVAPTPAQIHRKCAECKAEEEDKAQVLQPKSADPACVPGRVLPIVHEVSSSPGKPVDAETSSFSEPRFGQKLGHVRIHTDAQAAKSARSVNALVYTRQAKLIVRQANDPLEREGDRVADQVTRLPNPPLSIVAGLPQISRKCVTCEEETERTLQTKRDGVSEVRGGKTPAVVYEVLNSPAQPLDAATRTFMEGHFGRDFQHVRVHTGPAAAVSAQGLNALAYTAGDDIVFDAGQYAPETEAGRRLLAHELAHVVQQDGAGHLVRRQLPAQAQIQPVQGQDYRDGVQSTISFLNRYVDDFGRTEIDQARFERLISSWYEMVTVQGQIIDTRLSGDRTRKDALQAAYVRAIRALIRQASALFGTTEIELYRRNSGRIPMWAWQAPQQRGNVPPTVVGKSAPSVLAWPDSCTIGGVPVFPCGTSPNPPNNKLVDLDPTFRLNLQSMLSDLAARGTPFSFHEGWRTKERQQWLFQSSRCCPGPWRTGADGVKRLSNHQGTGTPGTGRGADCYPGPGGGTWQDLQDAARRHSLNTGLSYHDENHVSPTGR
jgi:hypothetical protein